MGSCAGRAGAYAAVDEEAPAGAAAAAAAPSRVPRWLTRLFGVKVAPVVVDPVAVRGHMQQLSAALAAKQAKSDQCARVVRAAHRRKNKRVRDEAIAYLAQLRKEEQDLHIVLLRLDRMYEALNQADISAATVVALRVGTSMLQQRVAAVALEDVAATQEELADLLRQVDAGMAEMTQALPGAMPASWRDIDALEAEMQADGEAASGEESAAPDVSAAAAAPTPTPPHISSSSSNSSQRPAARAPSDLDLELVALV